MLACKWKPNYRNTEHKPNYRNTEHKPNYRNTEHKLNYRNTEHKPNNRNPKHKPKYRNPEHKIKILYFFKYRKSLLAVRQPIVEIKISYLHVIWWHSND